VGETMYKEFVFPNTAGKLMLPSYDYSCSVKQNPMPTGNDFIDDIMSIDMPVTLHSEPVEITALPVPDANKPADFLGDVGKYALSASIDRQKVKTGEPVKLTVMITGRGNVSFLRLGDQHFPPGIEPYPVVNNDSLVITGSGVTGSKNFTFTLIPKKEGDYTISGITFSYYDVSKKEYVTLKTPDFSLHADKNENEKTEEENNLPKGFPVADNSDFLFGLKVVALLFLISGGIWYYYARNKREVEKQRMESEKKQVPVEEPVFTVTKPVVKNNLETASFMISSGNYSGAVKCMYDELVSSLCRCCEFSPEEFSVSQVRYRMQMKKFSSDLIEEAIGMYDALAMMKFSPGLLQREQLSAALDRLKRISDGLKRD
ncbi:MAG TPA: BatD family protein, partial [Bacteroidia bacterium]|nr:BatD family protein [Bacteroidia bacterium]